MSTPRMMGQGVIASSNAARCAETVRAYHSLALANTANAALLDYPPYRLLVSEPWVPSGATGETITYQARWPVSASAGYLWMRYWRRTRVEGTVVLTAVITDGLGGSVTASSQIPRGWNGETFTYSGYGFINDEDGTGTEGFLDVATMRSVGGLSGSDWLLEISVTTTMTTSSVNPLCCIEACEVPGFSVDPAVAARGIVPGVFTPDAPIADSATTGYHRLMDTIESARQVQPCYVNAVYPLTTTATRTPSTAATSLSALALMVDGGGTTVPWKVYARQMLAATALGETCRWRVLYRMTTSGAVKDGRFDLTMTSDVPTALTTNTGWLAYTTTWTWSDWIACAIPTDGTTMVVDVKVEGYLAAAGPTLWLGGLIVQGNQA